MENTDFAAISELLSAPQRILITTHTNPDGDALGSSLALSFYLKKKGHLVDIMVPDTYPEFLSWMPGCENILIYTINKEACQNAINNADITVAADYNQLSRLNEAGNMVRQSSAKKVLIDHHLNPTDEFDFKISVTLISSTSELVYNFIESRGDLHLLDKEIAECIYTGIITDTGSLSYACNYVKTYLIIAELFRLGINGEQLHRLIYDTYSENRLRLLGYSISDQLVVLPEFYTAFIILSKHALERFNHQIGDTEGIVNYALSIKNINLAALFTERDGIVKVSFRSKGNFSVNKLAMECFGGGGHRNAAGANCTTSLEDTVMKFRNLLPSFQSQLKTVY
ncbi:MAG: bifunctional oligoribonuclease/PAP phosphatase NrnA [Bacteroidetes bacterium]|nr:bifunctional oligoribonuclease/PAP phosphatase NrnA [Bacteroidota bacterium]